MLDTNFLGLFRFDGRRDMQEGLARLCTILDDRLSSNARIAYGHTYVLDLFYTKVRVRWDTDSVRSYVDDNHDRPCNVPLE